MGHRLPASFFFLAALVVPWTTQAQDLLVGPYLQNATPTDLWVLWETSTGSESRVDWGPTDDLGQTTLGQVQDLDKSLLHRVHLQGLEPGTRYHYRIQTDGLTSATLPFTTPTDPAAQSSFRFVVVSDTQKDAGNPDKWSETVEQGIMGLVEADYGPDLDQELAFVLVSGDLVDDGWQIEQWRDDFFAPAQPLAAQVPLYPVYGNHEANSTFYARYFHLPDNAGPDYAEHWWSMDYANARFIGLDSNAFYQRPQQTEWLQATLDEACQDPALDFVFTQAHHPFESELWPPGETAWSGGVISQLEAFTATCGKPSVFFFGHTHGYSRGQSRDAQTLMVNAATASGNIDTWGEYEQVDYDAYSVSQDEYGFIVVEVDGGAQPAFRLRRYGRGDEAQPQGNTLRDQVDIRLDNSPPATPDARYPNQEEVDPGCVALAASGFCDPDGDLQGAAHWQLAPDCDSLDTPTFEAWRQHENWYEDEDLQAGDVLSNVEVGELTERRSWCWRVRYRDRGLQWSTWSTPTSFTTGAATGGEPDPCEAQAPVYNPPADCSLDAGKNDTADGNAPPPGDCGCASGSPSLAGLLLAPVLMFRRRRTTNARGHRHPRARNG